MTPRCLDVHRARRWTRACLPSLQLLQLLDAALEPCFQPVLDAYMSAMPQTRRLLKLSARYVGSHSAGPAGCHPQRCGPNPPSSPITPSLLLHSASTSTQPATPRRAVPGMSYQQTKSRYALTPCGARWTSAMAKAVQQLLQVSQSSCWLALWRLHCECSSQPLVVALGDEGHLGHCGGGHLATPQLHLQLCPALLEALEHITHGHWCGQPAKRPWGKCLATASGVVG